MRKYDLARMLEEIRREDGGEAPKATQAKKVLTQEEIKAMARARRRPARPKSSGDQ